MFKTANELSVVNLRNTSCAVLLETGSFHVAPYKINKLANVACALFVSDWKSALRPCQ